MSTITSIIGTDQLNNSRSVINTNFSNLNTDKLEKTNNLSDLSSASTARTNLWLWTLATQNGIFSWTSSGTNTWDQTSIVWITGTLTQFNTALTGADFATWGGTVTGASSWTNTWDQTSIVGITWTKAQFNTAVTDWEIVYLDSADNITWVKTMSSVILPDQGQIKLTVPTTDLKATWFTCWDFNCWYSSSAIGDLVYLDSSATWQKCDANTLLLYNGMLGIALEVKASANALLVALPWSFVYSTTWFPTWTIGLPIYMSETAGAMTQTAPTTTDSATRVLWWWVGADKMYFFPSPDYITHI